MRSPRSQSGAPPPNRHHPVQTTATASARTTASAHRPDAGMPVWTRCSPSVRSLLPACATFWPAATGHLGTTVRAVVRLAGAAYAHTLIEERAGVARVV